MPSLAARHWRRAVGATGLALLTAARAGAQDDAGPSRGLAYAPPGGEPASDTVAPAVAREFRGVWIASVANMDWPSRPGLSPDSQRAELLALLDRAAALRLNAVILQVRPAADALYASRLEPWSHYLTGRQGHAPSPPYDPLAFAVAEAHRRGLELHAWFNPYRARYAKDRTPRAARHVTRARPSVVRAYGPYQWMDPGEGWVRERTVHVILDVVRRYDVDGVHLDDYFYPYPEPARRGGTRPFPDDRAWKAYRRRGGTLARDDWRRGNVDRLVAELHREIRRAKPWVKFGISPFGIWRPDHPAGVRGLDAYAALYADARKWLVEGWVDYLTPQLYWSTTAPQQRYGALLAWWRGENVQGRHLWPGNYTGRTASRGSSRWPAGEILDQIHETRAQLGPAGGNVHFGIDAFRVDADSLVERLVAGAYAEPALVPPSPWLSAGAPDAPRVRRVAAPRELRLEVTPAGRASPAAGGRARADRTGTRGETAARSVRDAHWWLVRARYADGWYARLLPATTRTVRLPLDANDAEPTVVVVSAVDHAGGESPAVPARGAR